MANNLARKKPLNENPSRISVSDKRVVNARADLNQLLPIKYHWAWNAYLKASSNHWMPQEVSLTADIKQWHGNALTEAEKQIVLMNCGFFSTAESLVANNLVLGIYEHISNPECRQYLLRQAYEEAIHTHSFVYIVESLRLDATKVFNMYREESIIEEKDAFEIALTRSLQEGKIDTGTDEGLRALVKDLVGYYIIMEGIFFYSGFAMILSLARRNLMRGVGEIFQYILRDESLHMAFGNDLINQIAQENPDLWNASFRDEIREDILKAVDLESSYARVVLGNSVLGMKPAAFCDYVRYIADRRLEGLGFKAEFGSRSPFPWMSEIIDLRKEKNFFETRVTEYQNSSGLKWDS